MAKIVSNLAHAAQDATKLRFVHRVSRSRKRKVEIVEFGVVLVALETVAHPGPLIEVVLSCPVKFISRRLGGRDENVNCEHDLGFAFDLADTQAIGLVHKDELEALTQFERASLGIAAQVNDVTTNLGGVLVDIHG